MNSEITLVLGMLDRGFINVDQAERLILRLKRAVPIRSRLRPHRTDRTGFIPPHFPGGFGTSPVNLGLAV